MQDLLRQKFLKVYANLPVKTREEIILDLPDVGPLTWNASYIEIKNNTTLGDSILHFLSELNFI